MVVSRCNTGRTFNARDRLGGEQQDEAGHGDPSIEHGLSFPNAVKRAASVSRIADLYIIHMTIVRSCGNTGSACRCPAKAIAKIMPLFEIFFKITKADLIWRRSWETQQQAEMAIFENINGFYNLSSPT